MEGRAEILSLEDASAERVLLAFARGQLRRAAYERECTEEIRARLEEQFVDSSTATAKPSRGELARAALLVLAEDPVHRGAIDALIRGPSAESFIGVETAAIITGVLLVLQTQVKFERDKQGRVSVKIEKKATSDSLLKPLVQKLLTFIGAGS